jgi:RNA polymerase sigma factor (sigma-70 family)
MAHGSVTHLIHRLHSEDAGERAAAARLIWDRYFRRLLALARGRLDNRVRARHDEEDVVQSAYKSFCLRQQRGEFDLAGRDDLWRLLVQITLNKVRNAAMHHQCARRDVRRQVAATAGDDDPWSPIWVLEQIAGATPTPEEALILNEALARRLQSLPEPELRQIALGKLEGLTNQELARRHDCTERSVERKLKRIRARWLADDPGGP